MGQLMQYAPGRGYFMKAQGETIGIADPPMSLLWHGLYARWMAQPHL
jgi:hypothetical protein